MTSKQRAYLRSLANTMQPIVQRLKVFLLSMTVPPKRFVIL